MRSSNTHQIFLHRVDVSEAPGETVERSTIHKYIYIRKCFAVQNTYGSSTHTQGSAKPIGTQPAKCGTIVVRRPFGHRAILILVRILDFRHLENDVSYFIRLRTSKRLTMPLRHGGCVIIWCAWSVALQPWRGIKI